MTTPEQALAAYQAGQLTTASQLADQVIAADPHNTNARQVKALVLRDQGDKDKAVEVLAAGLPDGANAAGAWNLLVSICLETGRSADARQHLERAGPIAHTTALLVRASCLAFALEGEQAASVKALEDLVGRPDATPGMVKECLKSLCAADKKWPVSAPAQQALQRWPDGDGLRWLVIEATAQSKDFEKVVEILGPLVLKGTAKAHLSMCMALLELDRHAEAERSALLGLEVEPDNVSLRVHLGKALQLQGKFEPSLRHLQKAVELDEGHFPTYIQLGNLFLRWGLRDESLKWLERGLEKANHPGIQNNLALELLSRGEFERGLALYESRLTPELELFNDAPLPHPTWQGESLEGKRLMIWGEQALGEQIIHFQAIQALLQRPDVREENLEIMCDARLIPILQRTVPGARFQAKHEIEALEDFSGVEGDYKISIGSLHHVLGADVVRSYGKAPYLAAQPDLIKSLRQKYEKLAGGRPIIGISWASVNPSWGNDKTISPELFGETLKGTRCFFVNLQYASSESGRKRITDQFTEHETLYTDPDVDSLAELEGFFAQVAACDHIATISNTTAHVAGAQGVSVDVLVPGGRGALWYWFQSDDQAAWYSSAHPLRQRLAGDWSEILSAMASDLIQLSMERTTPPVEDEELEAAALRQAFALYESGELEAALDACASFAFPKSSNFELMRLVGTIHAKLGRTTLGLVYLNQANRLRAADPDVLVFLARCYYEKTDFGTAIQTLNEAEAAGCEPVLFHAQMADIFLAIGDGPNGLAHLRKAAAGSTHPGPQLNLAQGLLRDRQFEEGFALYEARLHPDLHPEPATPPSLPVWDGSPLGDRNLLIMADQGLGDVILHSQAIPMLCSLQGIEQSQLSLVCDGRLASILARTWPDLAIIDADHYSEISGIIEDTADVAVSLASLHHVLGSKAWDTYGKRPFLTASEELKSNIEEKYRSLAEDRPIIGLSWTSGNPQFGAYKTVDPAYLAEVLSSLDAQFVSLEADPTTVAPERFQTKHGSLAIHVDQDVHPLTEFDHHLAQIDACDIVVTASNTVAHAAGALGKEVYVLLPKHRGRYWYWFDDRETGSWYPKVTTFTQAREGDWSAPLAALRRHLQKRLS